MRIAWLFERRWIAVVAMNRDLDFGALETMRLRVVGMEDEMHGNEEKIIDDGVMKRG
jgi:hypothetical protein